MVEQFWGRAVRESVLDSMSLGRFLFCKRIEYLVCAHFLGCVGLGLRFARVFCAIVRRKLFVSPRLKVTLHQVESFPERRTRRVEDPCTLGAANLPIRVRVIERWYNRLPL